MPEPIASSEELDAELARLSAVGGTPQDFEVAVKALAACLERPVAARTVLKIARVGWTSFTGPQDVPGDEPPEFLGRRWADLPTVARRSDGQAPRQESLPGESLLGYVGWLAENLFASLGLGEEDVAQPVGQAVLAYASVIAVPDLRRVIGWERSLDAHALAMLTAERAVRHLGEASMTADEEEACFRWLHLATYAEVPAAHLEEMRARRQVRLAHERQPAGAVAVMTCEVELEDALWFHSRVSSMPTAAMSREQLLAMLDRNAAEAESPRHWATRREGFGTIGRLDLTASAATEGRDYQAFVHGHLMRWMVEEDVPFRAHLLGLTTSYASSITRQLVQKPAETGDSVNALTAHARAVAGLRRGNVVPLADELMVMAWLMDQRGIGVRLAAYLEARDQNIAREHRR